MQFRHIKLSHTANLLLAALSEGPPTLEVSETVGADGLMFIPPLRGQRHEPADLAALQQHGLVYLRRDGAGWRVSISPRGHEYLTDTII